MRSHRKAVRLVRRRSLLDAGVGAGDPLVNPTQPVAASSCGCGVDHSMIWSARARMAAGIVTPSAFAVFALTTRSKLLSRQVGWPGPFEDPVDIGRRAAKLARLVLPVGQEEARRRHLPAAGDRRESASGGEARDPRPLDEEHRITQPFPARIQRPPLSARGRDDLPCATRVVRGGARGFQRGCGGATICRILHKATAQVAGGSRAYFHPVE
jgi:hypothetical protein